MKFIFKSPPWAGAAIFLAMLFIGGSVGLLITVNRHQDEVSRNVAWINQLNAVEQSLRVFEQGLRFPDISADSAVARWQTLLVAYRAKRLALGLTATSSLNETLNSTDEAVAQLNLLHAKMRSQKTSSAETKMRENAFRDDINRAIDQIKTSIQIIRQRQSELSNALAKSWRQLTWLVIIACFMAGSLAMVLQLHQRNLAKRQQIEFALRESEDRFRRIAENAPDLIYRYRFLPTRGFDYVSPTVTAMTGYTPEEHYADPDLGMKIVHPDDRGALESLAPMPPTQPTDLIVRWIHKNGTTVWTEQRIVPIQDASHHVVAIEGVARNISKRKQAEQALRDIEARFHNMADAAPVMLWIAGPDRHLSYCNKTWLDFTGRQMEQEFANGWMENIHPEDLLRFLQIYNAAFATRQDFHVEYRFKRRDGVYRWMLNAGIPRFQPEDKFFGYFGSCVDITSHKEAEDSLRHSEEALRTSEGRYRTLIEHMPDAVYRSTPEGKFLDINPAMVKMLGYASKEELLAVDIRKELYFDVQERDVVNDALKKAGGEEIDVFRLRRKDGREVWVEDHGSLIYDEFGKVVYHEGILRDITARKFAEAALHESEERYRSVISALTEGIILQDQDDNILACNASAERILGASSQQMRDLYTTPPQWKAIHEDGTPFLAEQHPARISLHTGQPCSNVNMGVQKTSGELAWISVNSKPLIKTGEEKPHAVVISFFDITERKWAEEALRESEERYRLLAENSLDLIGLLDLEGKVLYASPSHYYVIGYTPNELVHQDFYNVIHPDDVAPAREAIKSLVHPNARKTLELRLLKKNGDGINVEAILSGIPGAGNHLHRILFTTRDITARKIAEERIKASLHEKEVLLKEIHHRVKNNLQIISSLLNLQSGYIQDHQASAVFKESRNRVKSMALIHEKLYQSKDLARIDFAEYVRHLSTHLLRSYGVNSRAIALRVNVDQVLLDIDTAIPCGLIINELVTNSLKYAFPPGVGGEICIDLHTEKNGSLTLVIRDNGAGLPENFDFRQTESLGLQLVSTLTDQLAGTIQLERNHGTAFKILLQPHNGFIKPEESPGGASGGIDLTL